MLASVMGDQFMQMANECRHARQVLKEMIYTRTIYYKKAQVTLMMVTQESVQ